MLKKTDIIKIPIKPIHRELAIELSENHAFNHSMRGTDANLLGTLGEIITLKYLNNNKINTELDLQYNHDLLIENDITADVKTKERTVPPQLHYDCTIPEYNHHVQRPDIFIFVSLHANKKKQNLERFHTAYLLGFITMEKFEKIAQKWDPTMTDHSNNWKPTISCRNIQIKELYPL